MIRDGGWCPRPVRVLPNEGDVFTFSHQFKPKLDESAKDAVLGRIDRKLAQGDDSGELSFGEEGLKHGRLGLKGCRSERLDMKANGGLHIRQRIVVRVPLPDDDALHAQRVCDEAICVLLNDDLDRAHVKAIMPRECTESLNRARRVTSRVAPMNRAG